MSKATYKAAIKDARRELKKAFKAYQREVKKQKLLLKQVRIKYQLEEMGVVQRQIPVVYVETEPYIINVRKGV